MSYREPCPACEKEVHAVASRCRHCKADLDAIRAEAKAQAAAVEADLHAQRELERRTARGRGASGARSPLTLYGFALLVLLGGVMVGLLLGRIYNAQAPVPTFSSARPSLS